MNSKIKTYILLFAASLFIASCGNSGHEEEGHEHENGEASEHHEHGEGHEEEVHFSEQQFQSLNMKVDTLPFRNISSYVEANGQLEVPPQNEAAVTAIIAANVTSIKVIEGDKVSKGQVLAYLSHPDLIKLQTDYFNSWNQLQYLEKEYQRQKKLYEEKVGSGKEYQKIQSDYQSMKGNVNGYEAQLKMMGLGQEKIKQGEIYEQIPVPSPISGHIRLVEVKTGQYVQPQTEMFEIVNINHIHADLMVFEKDMHKVKEGQKVRFSIESLPDKELEATIYAVGKSFEQDPKAIHLHAEIENKEGLLIPGMYVRGRIMTEIIQSYALPEAAVVREGEKYFIFTAKKENDNGETEWAFEPVEVIAGAIDEGWIEVKLLKPLENSVTVAWNNAYYLLAEMKKGEAEHNH
jgi:cobalt-zinc-cadmium efflux system membrane fusion protein